MSQDQEKFVHAVEPGAVEVERTEALIQLEELIEMATLVSNARKGGEGDWARAFAELANPGDV